MRYAQLCLYSAYSSSTTNHVRVIGVPVLFAAPTVTNYKQDSVHVSATTPIVSTWKNYCV